MIIGTFRDKSSSGFSSSSKGKGRQESDTDTDTDTDTDDDVVEVTDPAVGWAYVGSHNFTPSAWGNLSGSGFNPTLNVSMSPKLTSLTNQTLQCSALI